MTFESLISQVELQIRVGGADVEERIKTFINDALIQFTRIYEWRHLYQSIDVTVDGSTSYELSDLTPAPVVNDLSLGVAGVTPLTKISYPGWLQSSSKSGLWTIGEGKLFVEGADETYVFLFTSCGDPYPLNIGSDENLASKNYPDLIKTIAIMKYLDFMGDQETLIDTKKDLNRLLYQLKRAEARAKKAGQDVRISAHNR